MDVTPMVKAAQHKTVLAQAVELIKAAKTCPITGKEVKPGMGRMKGKHGKGMGQGRGMGMGRKVAALAIVAHFAKQAGHMTKQAIVGQLGALLMRLGGKGLGLAGRGLGAAGLGGAGQMLHGAGGKLSATASKARRMMAAEQGHAAARKPVDEALSTIGGISARGAAPYEAAKSVLQNLYARGGHKALGTAQLVGAGGLGLGGYGLGSALAGGGAESVPPDLKQALAENRIKLTPQLAAAIGAARA